jgi:hypothetical protein
VVVKLAWKVLTNNDVPGRFLRRRACELDQDHSAGELGLVGFHVTQFSVHYTSWIWSTFEHVDNLDSNEGAPRPLFNDPSCAGCLLNTTERDHANTSRCKTQVTRVEPAPGDFDPQQRAEVAALNAQMRSQLQAAKSPLQYYRLVGVQYASVPDPDNNLSVRNLRNPVIETYLVGGTGGAGGGAACGNCCRADTGEVLGPVDHLPKSNCMACHARAGVLDDFPNFMPLISLCNCNGDEHRWIGDVPCKRMNVTCDGGAPNVTVIGNECPQ